MISFSEYNPKEDVLMICNYCGTVSGKITISQYTRYENDCKIAYMECPVCHNKEDIDLKAV